MTKKAQDFLLDSTLGEKSYQVVAPLQTEEEKIILSIEEGAVPVSMLQNAKGMKRGVTAAKNLFRRLDEAMQSMGKPKSRDIATFFRLFAIMINAGIPLMKSLDTISEQTVNQRLKKAVILIVREIEKGATLSQAMGHHPDIFSDSHLGMIRSGEASGQLNQVLKQLAIEVEKSAAIISKVKGAMIYPVMIIIVMTAVVVLMMVMVVPKITEVFASSGQELPWITKFVIAASKFMQEKWPWLIGGAVGFFIALAGARRTPQGKFATDWFLLKIPLFGGLLQKSVLARFSRALGNMLSSGIPIIQGLQINAKGLGNELYRRRVNLAAEDIARGIPLGESLRDSPEFPNMIVQMIAVGEQTAQLDNIAVKIAEFYEDEIDTAVAGISKIIEPVVLVLIAVVVGGIIFAVMLPIIQLTQTTGG